MAKKYQAILVKMLRGLAYCSVLLQWFFLSAIYLSIVREYQWFNDLAAPSADTPIAPVGSVEITSAPLIWFVSGLVIAILLVAFIYTFRRLPGSIVRGGDQLTEKPADLLAPLLLKLERRSPTKRRRLALTRRLVLLIKTLLVVLPGLLLLPVDYLGWPMEPRAGWAVIWFLMFTSTILFTLEYLLVKVFQTPANKTD